MKRKIVLVTILLSLLIVSRSYSIVWVKGNSMSPAIKNNSFLVCKHYNKNVILKRNQIVTFRSDDGDLATKRIIALPNESIVITNHQIVVNGTNIGLLSKLFSDEGFIIDGDNMKIPFDSIFVMGDNYKASYDSRMFGPVNLSEVKYYYK